MAQRCQSVWPSVTVTGWFTAGLLACTLVVQVEANTNKLLDTGQQSGTIRTSAKAGTRT